MILDHFPKVLWINLNKCEKRNTRMQKLLDSYNIIHTRIRAIDGTNLKNQELDSICVKNNILSNTENACTCSHIKAIEYFVKNISDDKIIIFEDDISFDFLPNIPFDWSVFENNLPKNYDIIQLAITNEFNNVSNTLVKTNPNMKYFCSAAYLITKQAATKILEKYYPNDKIDLALQKYATADSMISSTGNTYSIPIFTYQTYESTIHPSHLYNHNRSKIQQYILWKNTITNNKTFDLDTYFSKYPK